MFQDVREVTEEGFKSMLEEMIVNQVESDTHAMCFHYLSFKQAKRAKRSGIPAHKLFGGVPLSLRHPFKTNSSDTFVFNDVSKDNVMEKRFPNEFVLILSLPKKYLEPLTGFENDAGLCMISTSLLNTMRPASFFEVVDGKPWESESQVLLPSHMCIVSSCLIQDVESELCEPIDTVKYSPVMLEHSAHIQPLGSIMALSLQMQPIRRRCIQHELIPMYHYTSLSMAKLILSEGFRLCSRDFDSRDVDHGVYFSTKGPASFELGTEDYEINIIKDFYGVDRISEFKGRGLFDTVFVYGFNPLVLEHVTGASESSQMVSLLTFKLLSLCDDKGNYFLNKDFIFGAFHINHVKLCGKGLDDKTKIELDAERSCDELLEKELDNATSASMNNISRIDEGYNQVWKSSMDRDNTISRTMITKVTSSASSDNSDSSTDDDDDAVMNKVKLTKRRNEPGDGNDDVDIHSISLDKRGSRLEDNVPRRVDSIKKLLVRAPVPESPASPLSLEDLERRKQIIAKLDMNVLLGTKI
jgi:hypothetical protein